jgi:hypothetical protein
LQRNEEKSRDITAILADERAVGEALRRAVRRDILRHKAEGLPIAVWEDGRVKWIAPQDIAVAPGESV